MRVLFVQAAWVVLIKPQSWERHELKPWIEAAKRRLHRNVLAIALANKLARIAWSVLAGAMGRFLLTQMASVAELEAGLISERTKAALAAAKARGVKLGNPNGARALRGKQVGNKEAVEAIKLKAQEHATNLRSILDDIRGEGIISIRKIAEEFNRRGILAPRGGEWQPAAATMMVEPFGQYRHSSCRFISKSEIFCSRLEMFRWERPGPSVHDSEV